MAARTRAQRPPDLRIVKIMVEIKKFLRMGAFTMGNSLPVIADVRATPSQREAVAVLPSQRELSLSRPRERIVFPVPAASHNLCSAYIKWCARQMVSRICRTTYNPCRWLARRAACPKDPERLPRRRHQPQSTDGISGCAVVFGRGQQQVEGLSKALSRLGNTHQRRKDLPE